MLLKRHHEFLDVSKNFVHRMEPHIVHHNVLFDVHIVIYCSVFIYSHLHEQFNLMCPKI